MQKISRHKTRKCLFQALYSKIYINTNFNKDFFIQNFFDEDFEDIIDNIYFDELFEWIIKKESELIYIVEKFAPRFDIKSMSIINIIPIFISIYEILYIKCDKIPINVSIDEALEITKIYSDDHGRIFVNWILNSIKEKKELIKEEIKKIKPKNTYFFLQKKLWEKV